MSDRFGALELPIPAGGLAVRLGVLLDFARAVLVAQAQTAWADIAPREPNEIVAATFREDPRRCVFVERSDLPALFAFEPKGSFDPTEAMGDGYDRSTSTISLWWLFPPADKESKRPLDKLPAEAARVLRSALRDARHPAYVHDDDAAAPEAVRLVAVAPAVDTTYSGAALDGDVGAGDWPTPGRVLLSKSAGAWDTAAPVVVTVRLADGTDHAEEIFFTSATDAEAVEGAWIGERVVSVAVQGQVTTATLAIGSALSPAAEHGSSVRERMGVHRLALVSWTRENLTIEVREGAKPQRFDGVLFEVQIEETRDRTADALGYEALDDQGMSGTVTSVDGGVSAEVAEAA